MIHKHHIIPTHRGGSDDPSNIVSLSPTQHSMWHWAEYFLWGIEWDRIAAKGLAGIASQEETVHALLKEAASKGGKKAAGLGKTGFQTQSLEQKSKAGKKGGKHNKENNVGYCGFSYDDRVTYGKQGGLISGQTHFENKTGIFSESAQIKMLNAVRKKVIVIDKESRECWSFESQAQAAAFIGVSIASVSGYVNGHHQHKKYLVERVNL